MSAESALGWEEFAAAIAEAAAVPTEAVTRRSRLIEDLGLDSLQNHPLTPPRRRLLSAGSASRTR